MFWGRAEAGSRIWLPVTALVLAAWSVAPPYFGPDLGAASRLEVADHVAPGAVLVLAAATALLNLRSEAVAWSAGALVFLSGLWITATHLPLLSDAVDGRVGWAPAIHHTAPGPVVLSLGIAWIALSRRAPS